MLTNKQSTDVSLLSKQGKNAFETSHNISTTEYEFSTNTETLLIKNVEALQLSTEPVSHTESIKLNIDASTSIDGCGNIPYQNDQDSAMTTSPIKCNSTRKYNMHHVEEVKTDIYSEDSSNSDEDDAAAN